MTSLLLLKSMLMANALSKNKKKKKKLLLKAKPLEKLSSGANMCRICDVENGEIPIFNNFVHPNLPEEIHNISGVRMEKSDGLRKYMCQNCLNLLNGCILFRDMCQKTNKKIIEMGIKKEMNVEATADYSNYIEYNDIDQQAESDGSYNIPSPNHSEECTGVRCTYCDKDFPDTVSYSAHRTQCHKVRPCPPKKKFLCDVCGKTSKSRASLLVHKTTHENIFPYKCDICPYQGRTLDLLKVHKRSHLAQAERPYRCPHCPKATTSASNLSKHVRHVHSASKAYKCTYCERAFSFQHDMKRHIKEIHLRQGTVECDICFKKFNTKKILRGHQYKIHKLKGERQGRIPAYLQAQMDELCDDNINDNEPELLIVQIQLSHPRTMTSLLLWRSLLIDNMLSKSTNVLNISELDKKLCNKPNEELYILCRICYNEHGTIPILNNPVYPDITKEIHSFSGLMVEHSDSLSKHMCQNCLDLLNGCILFRKMCQKGNKMIIETSIMKENNVNPIISRNSGTVCYDQQADSDSYSVLSPNYSELLLDTSTPKAQCCKNDGASTESCLCDVCGKTLKSVSGLLNHRSIHEKIFPYKCDKCPYKGRSLDLLKTHKMSHLSKAELPYKCTQCGTTATTASNLSKHILGVHGRPTLTNKAYKCTFCERAFSYKHDVKRHIRQQHEKQNTVECNICFNKFRSSNILRRHQIKVHKLIKAVKGMGRIPAYIQAQME